MTLNEIPTRLEHSVNWIFHTPKITFALYTQEGLETLEVTRGQVETEIAVRRWRNN